VQGEKVCICGLAEVLANHKRVRKQIRKVSQFRKVRKSNKLFKSTNLRICNLRKLFADRPPRIKLSNDVLNNTVSIFVNLLWGKNLGPCLYSNMHLSDVSNTGSSGSSIKK
jgi:hypothetical protein